MSKKNVSKILSPTARTVVAFVFVFSQLAWVGQNQGRTQTRNINGSPGPPQNGSAQPAPEKEGTAASTTQNATAGDSTSGGGNHEGLKVHGHWTIEVRDPDGTVVTRREFENSLVTTNAPTGFFTGSQLLVGLLSGAGAVGSSGGNSTWGIHLSSLNNGDTSPCTNTYFNGVLACSISPVTLAPNPNQNSILNILPNQFALSGTLPAVPASGTIDTVSTTTALVYPSNPGVYTHFAFSSATLGQPASGTTPATPPVVPVSAGQSVAVTVTYTFQ